jgi:hypothetical protein
VQTLTPLESGSACSIPINPFPSICVGWTRTPQSLTLVSQTPFVYSFPNHWGIFFYFLRPDLTRSTTTIPSVAGNTFASLSVAYTNGTSLSPLKVTAFDNGDGIGIDIRSPSQDRITGNATLSFVITCPVTDIPV